jgi:hypothetical protein
MRYGAVALIPIGCFFLFPMVLGAIADTNPGRAWLPVILLLMVLTAGSLILGIWATIRPPGWLKPAWIRAEEQAIREGRPTLRAAKTPKLTRAGYVTGWVGLIGLAAIWLVLGLPLAPLIIGLGIGLALLVAHRP